MKRNMRKWLDDIVSSERKTPFPVLSFPATQLMNMSVRELISTSENMAEGICRVSARSGSAAALGMMDLSIEADAFGATINISDNEVPTVTGRVIASPEDADALKVPAIDGARAEKYIKAIELAVGRINDKPVFSSMIGPFTLAGRLMDVSEIMVNCYDEPDMVHTVLNKTVEFLIGFAKRYKAAGANGILIAEPVAGLLSPAQVDEFSTPYCKQIVDAIQEDDFIAGYHNCGQTIKQAASIMKIGASMYHFGNAIDLEAMLETVPPGTVVMGNIDPASQFRNGTPESMREATLALMNKCARFKTFIPSSGCDIPPLAGWDNIDAFFAAVEEYYNKA